MSCQVRMMPADMAMAGMCRVWLVEPPVACRATMELTSELLVDDFADRHEVAVLLGQARDLMRGFAGQGIAQTGCSG